MRIPCPFCGPRDEREFTYCGDAVAVTERPDANITDQGVWSAFVYDRANPAGKHAEIWQHTFGCRRHLRVIRDTETHTIEKATLLGPETRR